jgi:nucleotide-binding universal stress UspA family protein
MFQRILVATDGSPFSQKAVASAIYLASQNGADLLVITVVPRYPTSYLDGATVYAPEDTSQIEAAWAKAAQATLDTIAADAEAAGVTTKTLTVNSDLVAESIIATAKEHGSELIVMASHGRKGLRRLLLGSETQHVLTHSELPVLVLR